MLESFINKGDDTYYNTLRRFVRGVTVVPAATNTPVKIPAAAIAGRTGISVPTLLEGPQDGYTEIFALHGDTACPIIGNGTITVAPAGTAVTGTNTTFTRQVLVGDTFIFLDDTGAVVSNASVAAVNSDTSLSFGAGIGNGATAKNYSVYTPNSTDANNRTTVTITDMAFRRQWMNNPVPISQVFGSSQRPVILKEAPLLERNQGLMLNFFNGSTAAGCSFFPVFTGRKWQLESIKRSGVREELDGKRRRQVYVHPYWLTSDNAINIPDIGQAQNLGYAFFTNTGDVTLFLFNIYGYVIKGGTTHVDANDTEPFRIELSDTKTGRAFQSQAFTLNTGFGTGQYPFYLPCPIILEPRSQIKARIYSNLYTPNSPTNLELALTFGGLAVMTGTSAVTDPNVVRESAQIQRTQVNAPVAMAE
jgi:hypothetical protein